MQCQSSHAGSCVAYQKALPITVPRPGDDDGWLVMGKAECGERSLHAENIPRAMERSVTRPRRSICRDRKLAGNRSCWSRSRLQLEQRAGREAGSGKHTPVMGLTAIVSVKIDSRWRAK